MIFTKFHKAFPLLFFTFLLLSMFVYAKKRKLSVQLNTYNIKPYCNGVAPSTKEDSAAQKKNIDRNRVYFVLKKGDYRKNVERISSNKNGVAYIFLSEGIYEFWTPQKMESFAVFLINQHADVDTQCLKKMYNTPDATVNVHKRRLVYEIIYKEYCEWNLPCRLQENLPPPSMH
ncbi:MAG: hypothetical protein R2831_10340 [Chitinophagaceae bacterium]